MYRKEFKTLFKNMEYFRPLCFFNFKFGHIISQLNLAITFRTYYKLYIILECSLYSHLSL